MLKRKAILAAVVGGLGLVATANASPLVDIRLVGRIQGSGESFDATVGDLQALTPGTVIEYRVLGDVNNVGATNNQGTAASTRTIDSFDAYGLSGVNAGTVDLRNSASATDVSVTFGAPATLNQDPNGDATTTDNWSGTGSSGGTPGADLVGLRFVHGPGIFTAVTEEIIASGTFTVVALGDGSNTIIAPNWTAAASGSMKFNGHDQANTTPRALTVAITAAAATNVSDPMVGMSGMTLVVPEPGSLALLGVGGLGIEKL
jgi:hypothetical protein